MSPRILTIGHSNHGIEHFIGLLRSHDASAVADVRSAPFSRYAPQFNKEALQASLRQAGIGYVFLGKELGARTSDRSCYVDGQVQYSLLASWSSRPLRMTREALHDGIHQEASEQVLRALEGRRGEADRRRQV